MTTKRRLKYAAGKVAIYDIESTAPDDDPLTDPLGNVSRLHFHSDLPSPAVIKVAGNFKNTGSLALGAQGTNVYSNVGHVLMAHGQAGIPMVFGKVTIGATTVPLCGSVPLIVNSGVQFGVARFGRWCHLGADATNIILRVTSISGASSALGAMTIGWEVYVTNFLLDTGASPTADAAMLRIRPDYMTAGQGKFDSRRRFLRIANTDPLLPLIHGKTIEISAPQGDAGNNAPNVAVRYSVDGYVQQAGTSPGSFNATFTRVKF